MKIHDAMQLPDKQLKSIIVDGGFVREITYHENAEKPYWVNTSLGLILECKGHDRTEDLDSMAKALKPPGTHNRIRRYGPLGSTIN